MIINFLADGSLVEDLSDELETLAQNQVAAGIKVERVLSNSKKGEKSVELEMLTFVLGSVSTFVSILSLWLQTRSKYSVDLEINGQTVSIENPSEDDLLAILTNDIDVAESKKVKMILKSKNKG